MMVPAGGFSESSTVQAAIVDRLAQPDLGWSHIPGRELPRAIDGVLNRPGFSGGWVLPTAAAAGG